MHFDRDVVEAFFEHFVAILHQIFVRRTRQPISRHAVFAMRVLLLIPVEKLRTKIPDSDEVFVVGGFCSNTRMMYHAIAQFPLKGDRP